MLNFSALLTEKNVDFHSKEKKAKSFLVNKE